MASNRSNNFLGNQRVDVPHLKLLEAGVRGDFDTLAGQILAGNIAQIVSGFTIQTSGLVGQAATNIQVFTAGATMLHPLATASGTVFKVPSDRATETLSSTNGRVVGSFVSGTTNYIGIDLVREADDATTDQVQFLDVTTDEESPKRVPLSQTLDYRIYISTQDFESTPGIAPLAIVVTSTSNTINSIQDARDLFFRLGSGGTAPDSNYTHPWAERTESTSDFTVADKSLASLKDWVNAAMTRLWELGGGESWFSQTADRNVRMIRLASATVFASTGDWFEFTGGHLHWRGLAVIFDNSTGHINEIKDQATNSTGLTDLTDGYCIYVDLDRSQNLTAGNALQPYKAQLSTLGLPTKPGSRYIIAWNYGGSIYTRDGQFFVGVTQPVATTSAVGTVKLNKTPGSSSAPVVPSIDSNGAIDVTGTATGSPGSYFGVMGTGANSAVTDPGSGVKGTGGSYSGGGAVTGGTGGIFVGGTSGTGANAAPGVKGTGGTGGSGLSGNGVEGVGGLGTAAVAGGYGVKATGGAGNAAGTAGGGIWATGTAATGSGNPGDGAFIVGGAATSGNVVGARGALITGGAGSGTAAGGKAISATAGAGGGTNGTGGSTTITGGAGGASNGTGGVGATITGGAGPGTGAGGVGTAAVGGASTSGTGGSAIEATAGVGGSTSLPNGTGIRIVKGNGNTATAASGSPGPSYAGAGIVIESNSTNGYLNASPALVVKDGLGFVSNMLGRNGFPTSQVSKFEEFWTHGAIADVYAAGQRWSQTSSGGGTPAQALNAPDNSSTYYHSPYVTITANGLTSQNRIQTVASVFPGFLSGNSLIFQAEFSIVNTTALDANTAFWIGFSSDPSAPSAAASHTVAFRWVGGTDPATATWYAYCKNNPTANAVTNTGTGAIGAPYVLKIELFGDTTQYGAGTGKVVFSINGKEKVAFTTNLPSSALKAFASVSSLTATDKSINLGAFSAYWNNNPTTVWSA